MFKLDIPMTAIKSSKQQMKAGKKPIYQIDDIIW